MRIRTLINCMASDQCQKIQIRTANGWIKLFVDLDNTSDPDFVVLDEVADMWVKEWYVSPSAEIIFYTDEELSDEQIQLCREYGFTVV